MNSKHLRILLVAVVLVSGCSALGSGPGDSAADRHRESMTVTIVEVEDGDTFWFRNESGGRVGIRLIGIDTPEIKGRNYPDEYEGIPASKSGRGWLYQWGLRARNETRDRLVGETVRLEFDPNLPERDYYNRLVAYVYLNGSLVNEQLLESGYARVYPVSFAKQDRFERIEDEARQAHRGLWNYSNRSVP